MLTLKLSQNFVKNNVCVLNLNEKQKMSDIMLYCRNALKSKWSKMGRLSFTYMQYPSKRKLSKLIAVVLKETKENTVVLSNDDVPPWQELRGGKHHNPCWKRTGRE